MNSDPKTVKEAMAGEPVNQCSPEPDVMPCRESARGVLDSMRKAHEKASMDIDTILSMLPYEMTRDQEAACYRIFSRLPRP